MLDVVEEDLDWRMMLSDMRKGGRTSKIVAIGIHYFCDYIDYVFAYCKAKKKP